MTLIIGILIGGFLGIFLALIPGFNIGFAFLFSITVPDPYLGCGLVLGIEATSVVVKSLGLLSGINNDDFPDKVIEDSNKVQLVWTAAFSYLFGKLLGCAMASSLILFGDKEVFTIGVVHKSMALAVAGFVWAGLIYASGSKKLAGIITVIIAILSIATMNLPIEQPMFILVSSLFIGNSLRSIRNRRKIKINSVEPTGDLLIHWGGIPGGLLSSLLWGLPTSALCRSIQDDLSPELIMSQGALANAVASSFGLAILLTTGGARSASATQVSNLDLLFNRWETIGILGASFCLTLITYIFFRQIMRIYIGFNNAIPYFFQIGVVISTIGFLTVTSSGWFIPLALAGLMISKLIKLAEAPKELTLIATSVLPIISIFR
ncbi:hypothetical protein ACQFX9_14295 [Aliinostoc sp. HNIBRCY26]|uniref:hypothetical protein n=1 Tax=Aliinostoc sp. HNIBRCY26 TaxID=3418997 RepID=UPI003CFBE88A